MVCYWYLLFVIGAFSLLLMPFILIPLDVIYVYFINRVYVSAGNLMELVLGKKLELLRKFISLPYQVRVNFMK